MLDAVNNFVIYPPSPLSSISFIQNSSQDELKQKLTKAYEDKHKHETTTKVHLHNSYTS